jgi:hypothetical protein
LHHISAHIIVIFVQAKDMVEFLVLVNQIICKFKSSASAVLEEVFPTIASHLSVILSQDAFSAGPASNTEVLPPSQITFHFGFSTYITFAMYIKNWLLRKAKTNSNLGLTNGDRIFKQVIF